MSVLPSVRRPVLTFYVKVLREVFYVYQEMALGGGGGGGVSVPHWALAVVVKIFCSLNCSWIIPFCILC